MSFINPLAFIGLISIPAILIMYLLRQKYTEFKVPSLFLWKQAVELSKAQRPWQKLVRNILMILQMLVALFLVLGLAGPFIKGVNRGQDYILVLDTSMSMQATDINPTRFEAAKEKMYGIIENAEPGTEFSIITAGHVSDLAMNFSSEKRTVIEKLRSIKVTNSDLDLNSLKALVQLQWSLRPARVMIFSDTYMELEGVEKETVLIGTSAENCAVTLVSHVAEQGRTIVLVKVKNFGELTVENGIALYTDDSLFDVKSFYIEPGEEKDIFFTDVDGDVINLEARLTEEDALLSDNFRYDVIATETKEKTLLVTSGNIFLDNMLSLLPNVELYRGQPEDSSELSGYRLYIFDGYLPEKLPTDGHILIFNPPVANEFINVLGEAPVTSVYKEDNGLLKFISDFDFQIIKTKIIEQPQWAYSVMSSNETPLIMAGETEGRKIIVASFDLHDTDLPLKKEFPILMYNLIQWFIPNNIIGSQAVMCGDAVSLNTLPDASSVRVIAADGTITPLAPPFPARIFSGTDSAGFYILEQNVPQETKSLYAGFAVNTVKTESELKASVEIEESEAPRAVGKTDFSLRTVTLLLVLLLVGAEWWVYCRGK